MERWRVSLESSYFASRSVFQSSLDVKSFLRFFFNEFKCPTLSIRTVQASRIKASSFNRVVAPVETPVSAAAPATLTPGGTLDLSRRKGSAGL